MKTIFISYGHDSFSEVADKLYDSLTAMSDENGNPKYKVHKDTRGAIRDAHLWDEELERAIRDSDYILYLMSSYSVRPDSVCLDELAYARNRGGISVVPVRLENTDAPLIICRLQWVDWQNYRTDYENGLQRICEAIENYARFMQQGQGILFTKLFKSDYRVTVENVVGREPVIAACEDYIRSDRNDVFVISGLAGTGKSAVVSELSKNAALVKAVHSCTFDCAPTLVPKDILCNLAYFLSCSSKTYADRVVYEDWDRLGGWSLAETFDHLFSRHLEDAQTPCALVIDGIDEMNHRDAAELMRVLRAGAKKIGQVRIIVTARSEKAMEHLIGGLPGIVLSEAQNHAAAKRYIAESLQTRGIYTDETAAALLQASESNFLYLNFLFREIDSGDLRLEDGGALPQSLSAMYYDALTRRFDPDVFAHVYAPVLEILCCAYMPLSIEELALLSGQKKAAVVRACEALGFIIKTEEKKISVYHKSMREFLCDYDAAGQWFVDPDEGEAKILSAGRGLSAVMQSDYLKSCLFCHIFAARDTAAGDAFYEADAETAADCVFRSLEILADEELLLAAETLSGMQNGSALFGKTMMLAERNRKTALMYALTSAQSLRRKYAAQCDRWRGQAYYIDDCLPEAKRIFAAASEGFRRAAAEDPSYESRRDLLVSYNKLANIALREDNLPEAKRLYMLALEIAEQNAAQFPSYESRRDLSVSYNELANIALREDNLPEAKRLYTLALEIDEQNAAQFPSYESRRNLSVSYNNLANIALREDNLP
ncbi:MAG: toll/interleukin-1 receptor domain-containing protein, partial [Clostridia bacterium]|nr:toll/interleukin-1 receptor domain-containing protein [Clostridia bacterium]